MKRALGFTLTELLLTLILLSLVWFFCIPSNQSIHKLNQINVATDELGAVIHYAKTQARVEGVSLVLSPLPGSKDWSTGMVLFVDNKTHQYSSADKLIHEWHWKPQKIQITWHGFQSSHYLLFDQTIRLSAVNGYFLIDNGSQQRKLIINRLGRVRRE